MLDIYDRAQKNIEKKGKRAPFEWSLTRSPLFSALSARTRCLGANSENAAQSAAECAASLSADIGRTPRGHRRCQPRCTLERKQQ